jgi:RNA polymerase sigma factor (sigma-70 family)
VGTNRTNSAMAQLVLALREHDAAGQSDGQLLRLFLSQRDEAAFAALVRRHGPMVLGVCRRVLHNAADADDAFQATFLVLVRKASALRSRAVLGDWLHGVARHTALKARRAAARRSAKEQTMARPEAHGEKARDDWLPFLDEELSCMPEKYRLPIVLCDLEGRTRSEAAKHLGWPEGTVAGRLARGRTMLSKRLLRRGLAFSAGAFSAALPTTAASACVPAALVSSTIKAATLVAAGQITAEGVLSAKVVALSGDVMKAMFLTKLKHLAVVLAICAVGGVGWLAYGTFAQEPNGPIERAVRSRPADKESAGKPVDVKEPDDKQSDGNVAPIPSNAPLVRPTSRTLIVNLQEPIEIRSFQNPMTLRDFLGLLYELFRAKDKELPIVVDSMAFKSDKDENADMINNEVYDTQIKFPPYPKLLSAASALKLALAQIQVGKAEMLIRDGVIFITAEKHASLDYMLREKVSIHFEHTYMLNAVRDLAEMTGVSVTFDPRVEEKSRTQISATFRNDVTLGGALRIICDMAGLKMVDMQSGLYITTPQNAKELEKELREMKK